jgi:hypothetical protein
MTVVYTVSMPAKVLLIAEILVACLLIALLTLEAGRSDGDLLRRWLQAEISALYAKQRTLGVAATCTWVLEHRP